MYGMVAGESGVARGMGRARPPEATLLIGADEVIEISSAAPRRHGSMNLGLRGHLACIAFSRLGKTHFFAYFESTTLIYMHT